jgi:hypothetical protein
MADCNLRPLKAETAEDPPALFFAARARRCSLLSPLPRNHRIAPVESLRPAECGIRYPQRRPYPEQVVGYLPRSRCPKPLSSNSVHCGLLATALRAQNIRINGFKAGEGAAMKRIFSQRRSHGFVWVSLAALLVGGPASADRDVAAAFAETAPIAHITAGPAAAATATDSQPMS